MAGTRSQITDLVSSPEGLYCGLLYDEFRDFMLRQGDYDFAAAYHAVSGESGGPPPWAWVYALPADCVRIRQLVPYTIDDFDPQPMAWNIEGSTSLIFATARASFLFYTTNLVLETNWDSMFTDSFVRLLSSGLFMALENRIEAHKLSIDEALQFAGAANVRDP